MVSPDQLSDLKALCRSTPQRLWSPVADVRRIGYWFLGHISNFSAHPLHKREDIEYAAKACQILPDLIEDLENARRELELYRVELSLYRQQVPPPSEL